MIDLLNNFCNNLKTLANGKIAMTDKVMLVKVNDRHYIVLNRSLDYSTHENIINLLNKDLDVKDINNIWFDKKSLLECDVMLPMNNSMVYNNEVSGDTIFDGLCKYRNMFDDFTTKYLYVPIPKKDFDVDIKPDFDMLDKLDAVLIIGYMMDNVDELGGK